MSNPRFTIIGARAASGGGGRVQPSPRFVRRAQLGVTLGLIAALALLYLLHDGVHAEVGRALGVLATGNGPAIGDFLLSYGVWAPVASLFLMVLQGVAAPIPAILVAFANGLAFGVVWGGLLTVAGQTLAAAICFGIARALGRGPVEALAGKLGLEAADRGVARWGARGILLTRLVPGISFDVVSYGAGLTGIRFPAFIGATALGVAPQSFLYAYLIREAPQSAWIFYGASWLLIGVIGTAAIVRVRRSREVEESRSRAGSGRTGDGGRQVAGLPAATVVSCTDTSRQHAELSGQPLASGRASERSRISGR